MTIRSYTYVSRDPTDINIKSLYQNDNDNDNENEKTFIAKVVQRKSVNHTSTQFNLKDSRCQ